MNTAAFSQQSLAELRRLACHRFKAGGATAPEVSLLAIGDHYAVLKDYTPATAWFASCIAPLLIRRERSALRALRDLPNVPNVMRCPDHKALLIEYVPAIPLPDARLDDVLFERIDRLVAAMHDAGVAHADLRAARNILISAEGEPYIVDFVARVRAGRPWNPVACFLFAQFKQADRAAMAKLRRRHAPHLLRDEDQQLLDHRSRLETVARFVGKNVRRVTQALAGPNR